MGKTLLFIAQRTGILDTILFFIVGAELLVAFSLFLSDSTFSCLWNNFSRSSRVMSHMWNRQRACSTTKNDSAFSLFHVSANFFMSSEQLFMFIQGAFGKPQNLHIWICFSFFLEFPSCQVDPCGRQIVNCKS